MDTTRTTTYAVQVEDEPGLWFTVNVYDDPTNAMHVADSKAKAYGYRTRIIRTHTEISEMAVYNG